MKINDPKTYAVLDFTKSFNFVIHGHMKSFLDGKKKESKIEPQKCNLHCRFILEQAAQLNSFSIHSIDIFGGLGLVKTCRS